MKAITLLPIIAAAFLLFPSEGKAQNQASQENQTVNAIKIKSLKNRQAALKQQIAIEDNKRNAVIEGVSAETLEQRNARQDSICLELRSELVDVELELAELEGDPQAAQIAQQYNQLVNLWKSRDNKTTQIDWDNIYESNYANNFNDSEASARYILERRHNDIQEASASFNYVNTK